MHILQALALTVLVTGLGTLVLVRTQDKDTVSFRLSDLLGYAIAGIGVLRKPFVGDEDPTETVAGDEDDAQAKK